MITTDVRDDKITIVTSKDVKALKTYFEGIVSEENIRIDVSEPKVEEKAAVGEAPEREEVQDAEDVINFVMPNAQALADTEKVRKGISTISAI